MACYIHKELYIIVNKASKKKDRSIVVTCALLILFATTPVDLALYWKIMNVCFIDNGQSMLTTFTCSVNIQDSVYSLVVVILGYFQYIVADGLLVRPILTNTIQ